MTLPDDLSTLLTQAGLDPVSVSDLVAATLEEDLDGGVDVTTEATIPADQRVRGDLVARADGVVAGLLVAEVAMRMAGAAEVERRVFDGTQVGAGDVVLSVEGPTRALLTAERTALNFCCHLSGVATLTRRWADAVQHTKARVRDTRKTTPLMRSLEKYAVRCGGGTNHRRSLSDQALIKDNHLLAAGGAAEAFTSVRKAFPDLPVQVEVTRLDQLEPLLDAGAESILLDNMAPDLMREAVAVVAGRAELEASGGLTLDVAATVAETGVDFLAVGALTHSAPVLDLAFDLRSQP
ncbi:MAG: carboxylating nicotinate-nucleotide diphosphorylase [Nocardioidaceae bacterium]